MGSLSRSDEVKRKLRALKQLEARIRFQGAPPSGASLVWDRLFDLRDTPSGRAKYTLRALSQMPRDAFRAVVDSYFAAVYFELYRENGITSVGAYDPDILAQLDLPFSADEAAVKKRFRALAKVHHPDAGGQAEDFIRLMEIYRALVGR